jgi:hypothetical protein
MSTFEARVRGLERRHELDEGLRPVRRERVVLDVRRPDVAPDRLRGLPLVERERVEADDVGLVALQRGRVMAAVGTMVAAPAVTGGRDPHARRDGPCCERGDRRHADAMLGLHGIPSSCGPRPSAFVAVRPA